MTRNQSDAIIYALICSILAVCIMAGFFQLYSMLNPKDICNSQHALLYCQELITTKKWSF